MKVLVTGALGMLGSDLSDVFLFDCDLSMIGRQPDPLQRTSYTVLDLADAGSLRRYILELRPDFVLHAAAYTKVDACESERELALLQNAEMVKNLVLICNEAKSFLIFFSTDYVFSGQKSAPYVETDPIEPVNYYGETKSIAEKHLHENCNQFMIFRVTWLYGVHGAHFPKAILKQAAIKNEISVVSDQWGRPTWTYDLAVALKALLTSRKNLIHQYNKETFHIGNRDKINWSGYARRILDQSGFQSVHVKEISSAELIRAAKRPLNSVLCLDKAKNLLGLDMRPWSEALDDFLKLKVE